MGQADMHEQIWNLYMKVVHGGGVGDIEAWAKLDLTMPQMKILMILNAKKEAMVSTLADMMNTSLSNMTGILDRLEAHSLIERLPSTQDRRVIIVRLTSQAADIFHKLNQSGHQKISRVVTSLNDSEKKMVELGLSILAEALNKDKKL